ncbi:MAG: rhomboid family intramembrane serine protease [Calditrichaeota bacterium]|nr:MAG: rhomboid family intramembrane serine protease [Calditrichota bacterium]
MINIKVFMAIRKTKGSMVCPNCGRLVSVNAKECIHCGRKNPGLWGFGPMLQQFLGQGSLAPVIMGLCIVLYAVSLLLDPAAIFKMQGMLGLLSPSGEALDHLGMTGSYALDQGRWWTLVTAIYLHGSLLHIIFNMLWLRQIGVMVEHFYGISRTFLIFTIAGICGFFVSDIVNIPFAVGASGSIFGLLGALVYYGRKRGGVLGAAIYRQVGTWTLVLFIFGFLTPAVNNLAHFGGFVGGYLSSQLLGFIEIRRENINHHLGAVAAMILTVACFVLAIYSWIV